MSGGGVLGLDLAGRWGWAYVDGQGRYVASGCREMSQAATLGQRSHYLKLAIADLITEFAPEWVAVEKPINRGKFSSIEALRALYSYATAAQEVAYLREVGYAEFGRSTCCKVVLGDGRAKKPDGLAYARTLKPCIRHDDEADALLVALTAHRNRHRPLMEAA